MVDHQIGFRTAELTLLHAARFAAGLIRAVPLGSVGDSFLSRARAWILFECPLDLIALYIIRARPRLGRRFRVEMRDLIFTQNTALVDAESEGWIAYRVAVLGDRRLLVPFLRFDFALHPGFDCG